MDEDEQKFELWCDHQRQGVVDYLGRQRLAHGEVGEWPAWDVYPHAALWAVESLKRPGFTLAVSNALPQADLAPLLSLRGGMLLSFADDDDMWREEP
ncbi:DUF4826 family protein [Shinella kummerowiae]|jgi:hypothetical protein|uniref:DUF4826 family protein n=1 Tax=Shinella kummerowiae TaxID=417745 RepID=A0A6N8SEM6_9HYPH|nr:DUF4826 family protein [Shinella kummerowiae]MXN46947.1 DUF4826 family protein [Shinella kummerowiae]